MLIGFCITAYCLEWPRWRESGGGDSKRWRRGWWGWEIWWTKNWRNS